MIGSAAETLIKQRLSRFTGSTALDTYIGLEILAAQDRLEHAAVLPWFLKKLWTASNAFTEDVKALALPSDFLRENAGARKGGFHVLNADSVPKDFKRGDYDDLILRYANVTNAIPARYAIEGTNLYAFPTPDAAYVVNGFYYAADAAIADAEENLWLKHFADLIIAETGAYMAQAYLGNVPAQQLFEKQRQTEYSRMLADNIAREDYEGTPED